MKKIVLPTDFSDNAYNAISFAMLLLKDEPCVFYLFHAYTPAIYHSEYAMHSPVGLNSLDGYEELFIEKLKTLKKRIESEFKNSKHNIKIHAAFNILLDEVLQISTAKSADLVVMGTQGATGAEEIFLGSHTVHVIQKSKIPVLAVPSNFKYIKPEHILFATDYKITYTKKQLEIILNIAELHGSRLEVIYISNGNDLTEEQLSNKEKLSFLLKETVHLFHQRPHQGVVQGINEFQDKNPIEALVMIKNKHTFIERLFMEPVIKKIGFHISIPFLVLPNTIKI